MITQSYGHPHYGVHCGQTQDATTPINFEEPSSLAINSASTSRVKRPDLSH
jgi:hypothetical protein